MNLDLTEQQALMHDAALRFFARDEVRTAARLAAAQADAALWREAAALGFVTLHAAEGRGGLGMGLMEAALICEAAGRAIAPLPLAEGIAAASLLGGLEGEAAGSLLADALTTPLGFAAEAGGIRLTLDGDALVAERPDGSRTPVASGAALPGRYAAALAERDLLRTAWLIGAAARAVELAAAYATERHQFGKPIGTFQGVAFPLADSFTAIEGARLLLWRAIWGIASHDPEAGGLAALAEWWTASAARKAARRALRVFGGYGLSVEHDIHLYYLAINRLALAAGDPAARLQEAGDRLWAGRAAPLPRAGDPGIALGFTPAEQAYAAEVRAFLEAVMTPELQARCRAAQDGHVPELHRLLAGAGYAYPDWPRAWGGQGRSPLEITALGRVFEDFGISRIPIGCTNMGARMTMQFGSSELQAEVLPRMAEGSALSCLGFTEPASGSDMYAARTRAVRDGADWIITGQKMFTTGAHLSDYVLLLARTDPDAPKHKGLTIFLVPLNLPGITIQRLDTLQDERTNITFYDGVRVADRYRLGEVNGGLRVMAAAMEIEHGGEGYHIYHHSLMRSALDWANTADAQGNRPIDQAPVRARLARTRAHLEIADLFCRRVTAAIGTPAMTRAIGPMAKLFATDAYMADAADLLALTAPDSLQAPAHHPAGAALARIEHASRQSIGQTIYGGTSEVHRGIVAQYGLGLPRD